MSDGTDGRNMTAEEMLSKLPVGLRTPTVVDFCKAIEALDEHEGAVMFETVTLCSLLSARYTLFVGPEYKSLRVSIDMVCSAMQKLLDRTVEKTIEINEAKAKTNE